MVNCRQIAGNKLEALRRDAKVGEDAYDRGNYTSIEDDAALDRFFDELARETDKA